MSKKAKIPKVDSSIVKLTPKKIPKNFSTNDNIEIYSKTCKAIFPHKNKKVRNALIDSRHILGYSDKKELRNLIDSNSSLDPLLGNRVINTSPEEILDLAILLKSIIK